MSPSG